MQKNLLCQRNESQCELVINIKLHLMLATNIMSK